MQSSRCERLRPPNPKLKPVPSRQASYGRKSQVDGWVPGVFGCPLCSCKDRLPVLSRLPFNPSAEGGYTRNCTGDRHTCRTLSTSWFQSPQQQPKLAKRWSSAPLRTSSACRTPSDSGTRQALRPMVAWRTSSAADRRSSNMAASRCWLRWVTSPLSRESAIDSSNA